nr:unnamed protein product [Haemonchus contortus]
MLLKKACSAFQLCQEFSRSSFQRLIKSGLQTGRQAYPTLDDIVSDWSEKEESKDDKKGSSEAGKGSKGSAEDKPKADPVAKAGEKKVKDGVQ